MADSTTIYDIPLTRIDGGNTSLEAFKGKALLVVNTASKCGLTPQYEGLESLAKKYREEGLEILGFPSNEFMGQEPGSNAEIQDFCSAKFNVTFPMFEKIHVKGAEQHPLYKSMTAAQPKAEKKADSGFEQKLTEYGQAPKNPSDVLWNFEKFLISRNGEVVGRFAPDMTPDDPVLIAATEKALATPAK